MDLTLDRLVFLSSSLICGDFQLQLSNYKYRIYNDNENIKTKVTHRNVVSLWNV